MTAYYVAFWNVENLFDTEKSAERPEWMQKQLQPEIEGWNDRILGKKLSQLASVITKINDGRGPDILGVCEVENLSVLKKLVKEIDLPDRIYDVAHCETSDNRGMDIAFIYDEMLFKRKEVFSEVILKRSAGRALLQVTFEVKKTERELVVIGNHWPARTALDSEPFRIMAAETLAYWHERTRAIKGDDIGIIAMGDFNEQPFGRALTDYAMSKLSGDAVLDAKCPQFYNMMWRLLGQQQGTYFRDEMTMPDQFLVSKGMVNGKSGFRAREETLQILAFPDMVDGPSRNQPIRFGRPNTEVNPGGFSDHLPIGMLVEEV